MLRSKLTLTIIVVLTLAVTLRNWEHWAELFGFGGGASAPISNISLAEGVSDAGVGVSGPASEPGGPAAATGEAPPAGEGSALVPPASPTQAAALRPGVDGAPGASAAISPGTASELERLIALLKTEADPGRDALPFRPTHSEIELTNQLPFEAVLDWMMLLYRFQTRRGALPSPEEMANGAEPSDFLPESVGGGGGGSGEEEKRGAAEQGLVDAACTGTLVAKDPKLSEASLGGRLFRVGDGWPGTRYIVQSITSDGILFVAGRRQIFKGVERRR